MSETDLVVSKLDSARRALVEAKTIQETQSIVDVAAAAEVYARRQKLGEEAIGYAHSADLGDFREWRSSNSSPPQHPSECSANGKRVET